MNYFRVQGVGLIGMQGILVDVECVQSRRLPFLQILGASAGAAAEMRERVMAALEQAGCRLPSRRITVRFQPGIPGFSLENLDLPLVLALLAASGKIPARRLDGALVCGSLGLNGRIQAVGGAFAARKIYFSGNFRSAIVPWDESAWLPHSALANGGGFRTLAELISFLAGTNEGVSRRLEPTDGQDAGKIWLGHDFGARLLEIAAAGGHHALLFSGSGAESRGFAHGLAKILPEPGPEERWEQEFLGTLRGNGSVSRVSEVEISANGAMSAARRLLHPAEELLLAKNGVMFVEKIAQAPARELSSLFGWMEAGRLRWSRAGHQFEERMEANVVAEAAECECGGRTLGRCSCRPLDLQKYRRRLERALSGPFDLRYTVPAGEKRELDLTAHAARVKQAQERMRKRQLVLNARLSGEAALVAKPWEEKASLRLRALELDARQLSGLVRLALTLSDLGDRAEVTEADLMEARHYSWGG